MMLYCLAATSAATTVPSFVTRVGYAYALPVDCFRHDDQCFVVWSTDPAIVQHFVAGTVSFPVK